MLKYILDAYNYCDDHYTGFNILCLIFLVLSMLAFTICFIVWEVNFAAIRFILLTGFIGFMPVFLYWKATLKQNQRTK